MKFQSTRDNTLFVPASVAIAHGLSADGGLFVPESLPALELDQLRTLCGKNYTERAAFLFSLFLDEFAADEIADIAKKAYAPTKFTSPDVAPVVALDGTTAVLELWHGPTCAFKDMALQALPHLLTASVAKTGDTRTTLILVATSGDTGKAALEGFKDVPKTAIYVFYPRDGVSHVQKLQMVTQDGGNVGVCGIEGNFDDAQSGVKRIFVDPGIAERLDGDGVTLSSANSINFGRILPQIVYYVSAYCDLVNAGTAALGDEVNFVVPTGNFGNILAAYYAKRMGLPVGRLVCASNENNVLTDFIETGVYDRNRDFYTTASPSMDILISSNLERLLYEVHDKHSDKVVELLDSLAKNGRYKVGREALHRIQNDFAAGCCDDAAGFTAIKDCYSRHQYLMDTHTAVGYHVYHEYKDKTGDARPAVIVSTASPYKFASSVLEALGGYSGDEFSALHKLNELTGVAIPDALTDLDKKDVRFAQSVEVCDMPDCILDFAKGL